MAAYYCALDPATPMRVRGILLAALAYFIVRWRYRPLTWLWRFPGFGFTDDAAVLTALFGLSSHITPIHRAAAARALGKEIRRTCSTSVVLASRRCSRKTHESIFGL